MQKFGPPKIKDLLEIVSKRLPTRKRSPSFLEIAGVAHRENVASDILGFFLDPTAEHGMGDLLLRALLKAADQGHLCELAKFFSLTREDVTDTGKRLDLVAASDRWVVGIENKLFHHAESNPWDDYCQHLLKLAGKKKQTLAVLLTVRPEDPPAQCQGIQFIPVRYSDFLAEVKAQLGERILSIEARYLTFLLDFMGTLENLANESKMDMSLLEVLRENDHRYEGPALDLYRSIRRLGKSFRESTQKVQQSVTVPDCFNSPTLWGIADPRFDENSLYDSLNYDATAKDFAFKVQVWVGVTGWHVEAYPAEKRRWDEFVEWLSQIGLGAYLRNEATFVTDSLPCDAHTEKVAAEAGRILKLVAEAVRKAEQPEPKHDQ